MPCLPSTTSDESAGVRQGDRMNWLTARRISLYGAAFGLFFLILYGQELYGSRWFHPGGKPLFLDYGVFWTMARLAAQGQAKSAYLADLVGQHLVGFLDQREPVTFGWFYPPYFFFYLYPFSGLMPLVSYGCFMGLSAALFCSGIYVTWPSRATLWALFGFSGFWLNLNFGQNGFLTAGLVAWGLYWLEKKPILAGITIGLLSFKPQLGVLFPLVLVAGREWRCLISAMVTVCFLMLASLLVYGAGPWQAWVQALLRAHQELGQAGLEHLIKVTSYYSWVRQWGGSQTGAEMVQAVVAVGVALCLWKVWRSPVARSSKYALLILGSLMVSPYVLQYDLTWLAVWGVWWGRGLVGKSQPVEKTLMVMVWVVPALTYVTTHRNWTLPIAQLSLMAAFWWVWRRSQETSLPNG
ncbi:glycosyltransferase family 87 protein [Ferrovum myxofaciens]|nr:glycosyltransferase family 87 protein [Ferrovum myxofaciens]QKE39289.1 MAG: DUF2029 domain-containing protein [Ferrovum myxofaciens]